jgi:hypothetical protein
MVALFAALGLVAFSSSPKQDAGARLSARVLPAVTGRNGYEEFVQAAELIQGPAFALYVNTTPEFPVPGNNPNTLPTPPELVALSERLGKMNLLEIRREAVKRYGTALDLVRRGNRKEVFDPRTEIGPSTLFPELPEFRRLTRLFTLDSYVKFADGNPAAGTQALLDGLEFSYNVSSGSIIASLVGAASSAIVLAAIEDRLPMFSLADCRRAKQLAQAALTAPRQMVKAFDVDRRSTIGVLDQLFAEPEQIYPLLGAEGPESVERAKRTVVTLKTASPADRERWRRQAQESLDRHYQTVVALLKQPESQWFGPESDPRTSVPRGADAVVGDLVQSLVPVTNQILVTEAKQRTQFRLLALHSSILEFRWKNGRLPKELREAVSDQEAFDPLSGVRFVYERRGDGYRLLSRGIPATGEIELRYRRAVTTATPAGGPP